MTIKLAIELVYMIPNIRNEEMRRSLASWSENVVFVTCRMGLFLDKWISHIPLVSISVHIILGGKYGTVIVLVYICIFKEYYIIHYFIITILQWKFSSTVVLQQQLLLKKAETPVIVPL